MKNLTSRKWVFTSFKIDINWGDIFSEYSDIIRFLIVGKETCPKTKKMHWQGYFQFYEPQRMTKFQFIIEDKCHLESQRGTNFQASSYCMKDGVYQTYGLQSKQGARTDMEHLRKMIIDGSKHMDCYKEHFSSYLRYRSYFDKYRETFLKEQGKKFRNVEVEILSGPTRSGKTRKYLYTKDNKYNENVFKINCNNIDWFDGYQGEPILILDEFKNQIQLTKMLELLEGHICRLPIKGAHTYALWTKVVVTTNLKKSEIYPNVSSDLIAPFWARIKDFTSFWPIKMKKLTKKRKIMNRFLASPTFHSCPEVTKGNTDALVWSFKLDRDNG